MVIDGHRLSQCRDVNEFMDNTNFENIHCYKAMQYRKPTIACLVGSWMYAYLVQTVGYPGDNSYKIDLKEAL